MQFEGGIPLGTMWFTTGGQTPDATSGAEFEGKIFAYPDVDLSSSAGAKPKRSTAMVYGMICRNASGINLLPKRVVTRKGGKVGQVDGYCTTDAQKVLGVVDEWLPSTGVPNNDLFNVIIRGPCKCLTDLASGAGNVINQNDPIVALTAVTSQATTAGRVATGVVTFQVTSNVTDGTIFRYAANQIGVALSAKTTTNTNSDVLVDVKCW